MELAPKEAKDRESVNESIKYLSYLLRHGEEAIKGNDYLTLVKTNILLLII